MKFELFRKKNYICILYNLQRTKKEKERRMKKVKYVLLSLLLLVVLALVVLAFTKPESHEHYQVVKREIVSAVSRELGDNPLTEDLAAIGTLTVLNIADDFLRQKLVVHDYTFFTVGIVIHNDRPIPVTVGAFNHVWVLVDKEDVKQALRNSDMMRQIEQKGLNDLKELVAPFLRR